MNTTDQQKKRDHALTIYIDDPSIKELFTAAARRDNRKKSDWFRTHIMPAPRHVTMFERLRHEAESAFKSESTG